MDEVRLIVHRDDHGRFAKGATGNPGGRPPGIARFIRDETKDGEELAQLYLSIFRGTHDEMPERPAARLKLRQQAADWLTLRAFGAPVQHVDAGIDSGKPSIEWMDQILSRARLAEVSEILLEVLPIENEPLNVLEAQHELEADHEVPMPGL